MKLNTLAFGLAMGITLGATLCLVTLLVHFFSSGAGHYLVHIKTIYYGYSVSVAGALLILFYGFATGFVWGWLLARIYNLFTSEY